MGEAEKKYVDAHGREGEVGGLTGSGKVLTRRKKERRAGARTNSGDGFLRPGDAVRLGARGERCGVVWGLYGGGEGSKSRKERRDLEGEIAG